jgi:predicted metalloprotease
MRKLVEKLKDKPEHHRRRVTFAVSAGLTSLVFVVWVSVILPQGLDSVSVAQDTPSKKQAQTPFGTLSASMAQVYEAAKSLVNDSSVSVENIDLEAEFEKIKAQVESNEIYVFPENTR